MANNRTILICTAIVLCAVLVILVPAMSSENSDSTDTAHASDTVPDYETVFPDDKIQVINITISPESWEAMQEDMESNHGEFGERNMTGPGGMGGPRGDIFGGNRTPGEGNMEPPGEHGPGMMSMEDPIYVPATISFNNETWNNVGLRYKGVNSLMTAWQSGIGKISLKLDLDHYEDDFPETKNQKLYGFKELNLQSGMSDKSGIREKIVPEIFQDAGVPAPETVFCKVYLDHGDGPEYFGLYTLIESIDDTVIETQFTDGSGNLYKPEGEGATFAEGKLNLSHFEKKTNEDEADFSDVEKLYNTLHSTSRTTSPETWRTELESIFDVDEFITWLATNTLIKNWDTYGGNSRNYYLYNNPETGTFTWIPWDNNYALMDGMGGGHGNDGPAGMNDTRQFPMNMQPGEFNNNIPEMNEGFDPGMAPPGNMNEIQQFPMNMQPGEFNMNLSGMDGQFGPEMGPGGMGGSVSFSMENVTERWPLIRYLMDDPVYHQKYLETLKRVADESFNTDKLEEIFDKYHDLIESSIIGPDGEREGYTYLSNDSDFNTAYEEMKTLIKSQYTKAMEYLSSEGIE